MKTRLKITALFVKYALVFMILGPVSGIWWIITGNDFADKITRRIFKQVIKLEKNPEKFPRQANHKKIISELKFRKAEIIKEIQSIEDVIEFNS